MAGLQCVYGMRARVHPLVQFKNDVHVFALKFDVEPGRTARLSHSTSDLVTGVWSRCSMGGGPPFPLGRAQHSAGNTPRRQIVESRPCDSFRVTRLQRPCRVTASSCSAECAAAAACRSRSTTCGCSICSIFSGNASPQRLMTCTTLAKYRPLAAVDARAC